MFETIDELKKKQAKRKNKKPKIQKPKQFKTAEEAIRAYCKQCCCGSKKAVEQCDIVQCELWKFRCKPHLQITPDLEDIEIDE